MAVLRIAVQLCTACGLRNGNSNFRAPIGPVVSPLFPNVYFQGEVSSCPAMINDPETTVDAKITSLLF